nr:hypothetical protein Cplu_176 [Cedratvirus plubellavi]
MAIRQPVSLYSTVLKNYTYEEIRNLCFTEGSTFGSAFDCEWKVWRDKAVADFAISEEFFDLIRTLSGPQRYLQIASYVKLSPLSGVRVYTNPDREEYAIEGVYEAVEGYELAEKRRDPEMVLWFANRIKPEVCKPKHQIKNLDAVLQELEKKKAKEPQFFTDDFFVDEEDEFLYLIKATKKGRVDVLDDIIHGIFRLPKDFSIARDIPRHYNYDDERFWKEKGYLVDLPLQELDEDIEDIFLEDLLRASFLSGDTRIVDFYLSIFRDKKEDIREAARSAHFGYYSLLRHGNPEDAYGIALRTIRYRSSYDVLPYHMVEVAFLFVQTNEKRKYRVAFLLQHMGDITSIMAILPFCTKEDIQEVVYGSLEDWNIDYKHLHPLSIVLLKQHYQTL